MSVFLILIAMAICLAAATGSTTGQRLVATGLMITGLCGYALIGSPQRPAQPLAGRADELARQNPASLQPEALVAMRRWQARKPTAGHMTALGDALVRAGRLDEATVSYRAALRIDSSYSEALRGLADATTLGRNGTVTEPAMELYRLAAKIDPQDVRSAFMIGVGLWQSGKTDQARNRWDRAMALLAENDPQRQRLALIRQNIESSQ